jgi:polyphosphate kinase
MSATDAPQAAEGSSGEAAAPKLGDPANYFNRELSWLDFNLRVLELAEDPDVLLLERTKFASIYSSNLDEYFMVRVAGLHDQIEAGVERPSNDGRTPSQTLEAIHERVVEYVSRLARCVADALLPGLAEHEIVVKRVSDTSEGERRALARHFRSVIFPALTPLAVGPGQPFPYISNLSLSLGVIVRDPESGHTTFARVKVPTEVLPRFVALGGGTTFVLLEDVIAHHLDALFPGMEIAEYDYFRVTRDADLAISDEADDLLQAVEDELRRRRLGEVVRVEVGARIAPRLLSELTTALDVSPRDVYPVEGMLDPTGLLELTKLPGFAELRDAPYTPVSHPRIRSDDERRYDVMGAMRDGDLLVHHPYDSFASSVEAFVEQAVNDPQVLAIKQTVYRTSDDSTLVPALIRAAERGKQAVCLVELQARFDERTNIHWAKALEQAGVHVVYGHPAMKTHAKCVLVVRREGDGVRNYVHIGTGNYHSATARLYTDFGLFTTDEAIGSDVAELFNYLTGFGRPSGYRKVLVAPWYLRNAILGEIADAVAAHSPTTPARIGLKINALVDRACIDALYLASRAGVRVDLNVRGICCLRPGVPGLSENIRVVSVVGRFLEHSRIYAFAHGRTEKVYISSADLMPRNLNNRVELAVPIEDEALREQVLEVLELCLADNHNAWELGGDGVWTRRRRAPGEQVLNAQEELMRRHSARAAAAGRRQDLVLPPDGTVRRTFGGWLPSRVSDPYTSPLQPHGRPRSKGPDMYCVTVALAVGAVLVPPIVAVAVASVTVRIGSTRGSVQRFLPATTSWPVITSKATEAWPVQLICTPGMNALQLKLSRTEGTPFRATTGDWSKYWI